MGIQLNNISFGSSYSAGPLPKIKTVSVDEVRQQEEQKALENRSLSEAALSQEITPIHTVNAPLEDVSVTFNKQDSYDYIGKDSDIRGLDVQKVISDMKKDQVLRQYQFFVKPSGEDFTNSDGKVIAK